MNKNFLSIIKYIVIFSIGVALLWLAFRGVNIKDTIHDMLQANLVWVLISVAASLVAFVSRAIRWNMLIEPLGYKPSFLNTSAALMIGYLANLAVPRLGEITRCGTLSKTQKVPLDSLIGTVIIERIVDVVCLLICLVLVAIMEYNLLVILIQNVINPKIEKLLQTINSPLSITIGAIVLIFIIWYFFKLKKKSGGIYQKISGVMKSILVGIDTIRKLKSPIGFLFHTILIWLMYFLMSYSCFFSLKATSILDWHAGLFVLVAGGLGMSAPVQGGIGTYHILVSEGLRLYGIAKDPSLVFATLMHTSQTLTVIVLGGLAFLYLSIKRKNETAQLT